MTFTTARRILAKLDLPPIATVEQERRQAAWENREPRSLEQRVIKQIEMQFAEVSGLLEARLTAGELDALRRIPSEIARLI